MVVSHLIIFALIKSGSFAHFYFDLFGVFLEAVSFPLLHIKQLDETACEGFLLNPRICANRWVNLE